MPAMLRNALAGLAAAACVCTAADAPACDWNPATGGVLGVASDGSFIHHSASYYNDRVELFDINGKLRAGCTRNNDGNDSGAWTCRGEKSFRGRRKESPLAAAKRWAEQLGGVTPLSTAGPSPPGLVNAFCSRIVFQTGAGPFSCRPKDDLRVVTHPASPLVFFRYRISFHFCGPFPNVEEDDTWLSRPALSKRLQKRIERFERLKVSEQAERAKAALAWLESPAQSAEQMAYLLYQPYELVLDFEIKTRVARAMRAAKAGFARAEAEYAQARYDRAAEQFLQVARVLRAVRDPLGKMVETAGKNQVICYRNAALAWRMAGRCSSGRAFLLQAAEPDHDIAAAVHALAEGMGLEGPEAANCR
jgi:hypothetical protein